jgi:drug/metabolite transporter (DMT)-like permease
MIWGMAFVFQRTGMEHIGPLSFNAARQLLAALTLLVLVIISDAVNKKRGTLPSRVYTAKRFADYKKNTLIGGTLAGVVLVFAADTQQIGMVSTSAGKSGFITALYVVLVPIAGYIIFRNRPTKLQWFAVVMATGGLYLLSVRDGFGSIESGDLWLIACAFGYMFYILVCDRYAYRSDPIRMSFIQFVVSGVLQVFIALIFEGPFSSGWSGWGDYMVCFREAAVALAYCGIASSGLGFTGQILGQKYTDSVSASLIMCLESVFAALAGAIFLRERMAARELTGCIIMFAAIIISQLPEPKRKAPMGMPKA